MGWKIGIVTAIFLLILVTLVGKNFVGLSETIRALADPTLKGIAVLQGEKVQGVTA